MIATLRLEAIGDNLVRTARAPLHHVLRQLRRVPAEQRRRLLAPGARPWVAHIVGRTSRGGLDRRFLEGLRDYRDANGTGSRGVMLTFILYPQRLYEVNELQSWKRMRRFFCEAVDGKIVELPVDDVARRLTMDASTIQSVIDAAAEKL
jgi:hypothetical protein